MSKRGDTLLCRFIFWQDKDDDDDGDEVKTFSNEHDREVPGFCVMLKIKVIVSGGKDVIKVMRAIWVKSRERAVNRVIWII